MKIQQKNICKYARIREMREHFFREQFPLYGILDA